MSHIQFENDYQLQIKYLLKVSRPEQFPYLARLTIRIAPGAGTIICGASFLQDRSLILKLVIVVAIIQWKYRNHYWSEGFCWLPSIVSKTFTIIVADQPTALPGLEKLYIFLTTFEMSSVFETWTILMIALASSTFRLLTLSWGNDLEFHLDSFSFMKSFMVPKTWEYLKWKGSTTSHRQLHSIADGLCSQSYIHSTIEQFSSLLLADGAAVISPLWSLPMMLSSMFSINLGLPLDQSLWLSIPQVRRYKSPLLRSVHALSMVLMIQSNFKSWNGYQM